MQGVAAKNDASYDLSRARRGTPSSHLQPLNDGLDAGVGPNGSIERVGEREIDSTDVRRGALHPPLDRRLPVARPHEGVGDEVESKVGEIPAAPAWGRPSAMLREFGRRATLTLSCQANTGVER